MQARAVEEAAPTEVDEEFLVDEDVLVLDLPAGPYLRVAAQGAR